MTYSETIKFLSSPSCECGHGPLLLRQKLPGGFTGWSKIECLYCNDIGNQSRELLANIYDPQQLIKAMRKMKCQNGNYIWSPLLEDELKGMPEPPLLGNEFVTQVHEILRRFRRCSWRRKGWRKGEVENELCSMMTANRKLIESLEYSSNGRLSPVKEKEFDARDKEIDSLHQLIMQIDDLVESDYLRLKLYEWVRSRESRNYQDEKTMPCFSCRRKRTPDVYFLENIYSRYCAVLCWPCECEYGLQPTSISNWPVAIPPPV